MPPLTSRPSLRLFIALPALLLSAAQLRADISFTGLNLPAIAETPPASTGLAKVYVLPYTEGVKAEYEAPSTSAPVKWERFSAMGAAYAQEVASSRLGNVSRLAQLEPNVGYIVTCDGKSEYFWVIDHSSYPLELGDLMLEPTQSDCSTTWLEVSGFGERLPYYSINGVPQWLSRDLQLSYLTLEFDEEQFAYTQVEHTESIEGFSGTTIHCPPALCETDFRLSGDRFLRQWGEEKSVTSPVYAPTAVSAEVRATQTEREVDNEQKVETALGGSGPVEVRFEAAVTDAAIYHEWELARDAEFNQTFLRSQDLEFTHTFREQGTVYVRMLAANDAGGCEYESETFEVFVGESALQCPNAFSPGTSEGVNDEWKVSYKSIIEFDCHIFDRQGRELAHLTDPSQGWDGKRAGKTVPAGVYFYVIRATGADGKKYKLSGDINVIGFKRRDTTNNPSNY